MSATQTIRELAEHAAQITRESEEFDLAGCDCDVFDRNSTELPTSMKPWIGQMPDGYCYEFDTEEQACEFQRHYRVALGLDPMTGEWKESR